MMQFCLYDFKEFNEDIKNQIHFIAIAVCKCEDEILI